MTCERVFRITNKLKKTKITVSHSHIKKKFKRPIDLQVFSETIIKLNLCFSTIQKAAWNQEQTSERSYTDHQSGPNV